MNTGAVKEQHALLKQMGADKPRAIQLSPGRWMASCRFRGEIWMAYDKTELSCSRRLFRRLREYVFFQASALPAKTRRHVHKWALNRIPELRESESEMEELRRENERLRAALHERFAPGGDGCAEAKKHFERLKEEE